MQFSFYAHKYACSSLISMKKHLKYPGALAALIVVGGFPLTTHAAPPPFPCMQDANYVALDFMLGDWSIEVNGTPVAWITLEKDGQNCIIRERYGVPSNSHSGAGVDYWDPASSQWRRILITSVGTIETFEGVFVGDKFVWNGREKRMNGTTVRERVEIWREGGVIRNDIYQSEDNGETWLLRGSETRRKKMKNEIER